MSLWKVVGTIVLVLVVILAIGWIFAGNNFFMYKYFAPKQTQVQRDTFEHSRAFNQGMVQELENMQAEYVTTTDPGAKKALAGIILHRVSGYNLNDPSVSADLRDFIAQLKREQAGNAGY